MNILMGRPAFPMQRASSAVALVLAAATLASPASAQSQSAAPTPAATPDSPADPAAAAALDPVDDIVVTARKRTENLRDVPVAITAISGKQLQEQNITRLTDLVTLVPSFTLSQAAVPFAFVRGFGTGGNPSFEQAVGKFVDNVSYGRYFDARIPLYDLERFELLKGPQVLLYGNSTTAGALNITTKKPGTVLAADGSIGYEFNNRELFAQGGVTLPITSDVAIRLAGYTQILDHGWVHNDGTGRDDPRIRNVGFRGTLRATPAPGMTVVLKAEIARLRDHGAVVQPIRQATSPSRAFLEVKLDDHRNADYSAAPFNTREYNALNNDTYQADVGYNVAGGTLTSTTAYRRAHQGNNTGNGSQIAAILVPINEQYRQFSQELRFAGSYGSFDLLAGGYYERDSIHDFAFQLVNLAAYKLPLPPFARFSTLDQIARNYSGFGDVTWHITPTLSIEGGARYSVVRKSTDQASNPTNFLSGVGFSTTVTDGRNAINPALNGLMTSVFGAIPHDFRGIRTNEEHLQPQVVIQYKYAPNNMLYGKYVKGDKAGGVDVLYGGSVAAGATPAGSQFAPERARSFELGAKGLVFDHKLDYAVTLYDTVFQNLQTSVFIGTSLFVSNVGRARTRGVEVELGYAVAPGLRLTTSGAFNDARYLSYPGAACTVDQTLATPAGTVCKQDLSGARTPFGSRFSASLGATYERTVGDWTVKAGANVVARTRFNTALNNDPLGDQHGFANVDAHIDLAPSSEAWSLSLFGRNLGNVQYKEYSVASPIVPGGFNTFISRGRQIGLRLGFRLD